MSHLQISPYCKKWLIDDLNWVTVLWLQICEHALSDRTCQLRHIHQNQSATLRKEYQSGIHDATTTSGVWQQRVVVVAAAVVRISYSQQQQQKSSFFLFFAKFSRPDPCRSSIWSRSNAATLEQRESLFFFHVERERKRWHPKDIKNRIERAIVSISRHLKVGWGSKLSAVFAAYV